MYKFLAEGSNYIVFNPHDRPSPVKENTLQVVFIDPGTTHFALRISRRENNSIKTILHERKNFKIIKGMINTDFFNQLSLFLNSIQEITNSHYIVVESQFKSLEMIRTCQHIISVLMEIIRNKGKRPLIYELDPKLKHVLLRIPKEVKGRDAIKEWCKKQAVAALILRGEDNIAREVSLDKKYDISDCVCYDIVWYNLYDSGQV